MQYFYFLFALSWAGLSFAFANVAPLNTNFQIRNNAGTSSDDTLYALRRSLSSAAAKRDTVFKNSTSLNKSWNDVTLFSFDAVAEKGNTSLSAGVEIVCTTCYIKGTATAQFTINSNLNVTQVFHNVTSSIETEVSNITTSVVNYVKNYLENATTLVGTNGFHISDFEFGPLDIDFDVKVPDIPSADLSFQFDGMELYMEIDTILSSGATYTLNLYTSTSPIGFAVAEDLLIGVVFSVDLILSVESQVDISTGFHILLHDGLMINIPMFDHNVSDITFQGGHFEFLPVTIQSSSVVLTGLLRVGIKAGLDMSKPTDTIAGVSLSFSAGLEAGVWADVAKFVTNVTAAPAGSGSGCELGVVEEYTFLLGANAGATLALDGHTWGPAPTTQIPLFFTTVAAACALTRTVSAAATDATITARAAGVSSTTTTTEVKYTYTATQCLSTGLINCPVSLQSTSQNTVTKTLVTVVPSGSEATFITAAPGTSVSAIAFGQNIKAITSISGSPVSYVPPTFTPTATGIVKLLDGMTGGVSNKLIIGVSVGVGVPVLIGVIAGFIFFCRRKRSARSPVWMQQSPISEPYTPASTYGFSKKSPVVTVTESRRRGS